MIEITVKGFVDFMLANASQQRKTLRDYKYPEEAGTARAVYYKDARDTIEEFHRSQHDADWLRQTAKRLSLQADLTSGAVSARFKHNARVLRSYAKHFATVRYLVLPQPTFHWRRGEVMIRVTPDLYVLDARKNRKLIKFDFSANQPEPKFAKRLCQIMYEAQLDGGFSMTSRSIQFIDITRNEISYGARAGARIKTEIDDACRNIEAIWPTLNPRTRKLEREG